MGRGQRHEGRGYAKPCARAVVRVSPSGKRAGPLVGRPDVGSPQSGVGPFCGGLAKVLGSYGGKLGVTISIRREGAGQARVFPGRSATLSPRPGGAACVARASWPRAGRERPGSPGRREGAGGRRGAPETWGVGSRDGLRIVGSRPEAALGSLAGALVLDRGNLEKAL